MRLNSVIVFIILGCVHFSVTAQVFELKMLTVHFSPTAAGTFMTKRDAPTSMVDSFKRVDKSRLSLQGGVSAYWKLGERLMLQLGVQYNQAGFKRALSGLKQHDSIPYIGTITDFSQTGIKEADLDYRFHYIELPVILHYRVAGPDYFSDKINNFVYFGLSPQISIADSYHTHLYGYTINEESDFLTKDSKLDIRTFNVSAIAGVRIEFDYSDNMIISLQPSFAAALFSANTGSKQTVGYYPYTIGLNVGLNYVFY